MSRCLLCCFDRPNKAKPKPDELTIPCTEPSEGLDTILGMAASERQMVKETSDVVFKELNFLNKSVAFLIAFFKRYPHHQRYFKMFRDVPPDELKSLPVVENHGRRVMDQMLKLVHNMDDPDSLQVQLAWISMKHKPRKVRSRQFKDMLTMFVEFTSQEMGDHFTEQHDHAWRKWIAYILSVLEAEESKTCLTNGRVAELGDHAAATTQAGHKSATAMLKAEVHEVAVNPEPDLLQSHIARSCPAEESDGCTNKGESDGMNDHQVNVNRSVNAGTGDTTKINENMAENRPVPDSVNRVSVENARAEEWAAARSSEDPQTVDSAACGTAHVCDSDAPASPLLPPVDESTLDSSRIGNSDPSKEQGSEDSTTTSNDTAQALTTTAGNPKVATQTESNETILDGQEQNGAESEKPITSSISNGAQDIISCSQIVVTADTEVQRSNQSSSDPNSTGPRTEVEILCADSTLDAYDESVIDPKRSGETRSPPSQEGPAVVRV